jgi:hypothetical protein
MPSQNQRRRRGAGAAESEDHDEDQVQLDANDIEIEDESEDGPERPSEIVRGKKGPKYQLPKLPKYDGDPKKTLVKIWKYRVDQHFRLGRLYGQLEISPEDQVLLAAENFSGRAQAWWATRILQEELPKNLDELEIALKKYFEMDTQREKLLRNRYRGARQIGSVSQYNDYFLDIVVQLGDIPEALKIHDYINGLHPQIGTRVEETQPRTLKEAMSTAMDKERFSEGQRMLRGRPMERTPGNTRDFNSQRESAPWKRKFERTRTPTDKSHITCFVCSKKGHYASECPDAPTKTRRTGGPDNERWNEKRQAYLKKMQIEVENTDMPGND